MMRIKVVVEGCVSMFTFEASTDHVSWGRNARQVAKERRRKDAHRLTGLVAWLMISCSESCSLNVMHCRGIVTYIFWAFQCHYAEHRWRRSSTIRWPQPWGWTHFDLRNNSWTDSAALHSV